MNEITQDTEPTTIINELASKQNNTLYIIEYDTQLTRLLGSLINNKILQKDSKKTLELCSKVEAWLSNWLIPSITPIVNSMSINLKIPHGIRKLNSLLMILPRGTGKSELLDTLLAQNNPKIYQKLDSKVFESDLITYERDYFHNKIMVHDDLISMFGGLNQKQRQQLTAFWTRILEGEYSRRRNKLENVRTMVMFGLATEKIDLYKEELISDTFFDRAPAIKSELSDTQKRQILEFKSKHKNLFSKVEGSKKPQKPSLKLPLPSEIKDDKKIEVRFPYNENMEKLIMDYAMELDIYDVQSFSRAQDYIKIFMMSNALLNKRRTVKPSDLLLYSIIHPLFIKSGCELGTERHIQNTIASNPGTPDKILINMLPYSRPTFYKYKKILQRKGVIP